MDTSSFINALCCFLAIRGPVKLISSDCETNFKGACKESNVSRFLSKESCTWICKREYLPTLQSRSKWQKNHPNIKEGDLVLLCDTQVKRNQWPMALVTKTFPASDGKVRKLELKVLMSP